MKKKIIITVSALSLAVLAAFVAVVVLLVSMAVETGAIKVSWKGEKVRNDHSDYYSVYEDDYYSFYDYSDYYDSYYGSW